MTEGSKKYARRSTSPAVTAGCPSIPLTRTSGVIVVDTSALTGTSFSRILPLP